MAVIVLIDEHTIFRSGLRNLIESRIAESHVVDAPSLEADPVDHVELVLVDLASLTQDCLQFLEHVHELHPHARFAILSNSQDTRDVLRCLSAGFHGFIHKLDSESEIVRAITDLISGRIYVPHWIVDRDHQTERSSFEGAEKQLSLTPRQRQVLPLLAQGLSNKEIARELQIAEGTTKIHVAALMRALGARNRTEAAFLSASEVATRARAPNISQMTTSFFQHQARRDFEDDG